MSTISEIEQAIEQLSAPQVDELTQWLEAHRARRATELLVEASLNRARSFASRILCPTSAVEHL